MLERLLHRSLDGEMEFLKLVCVFLTVALGPWHPEWKCCKRTLQNRNTAERFSGWPFHLTFQMKKIISPLTLFKHLAIVSWSSAKKNHLKFCLWFVRKSGPTFKRRAERTFLRMCELIMNPICFKNIQLVNSWNAVLMETPAEFPGVGLSLLTSKPFTDLVPLGGRKLPWPLGNWRFLFLDIQMILSTF